MTHEEINQQKKSLVILTGPTASGKTSLSIKLAKRINGEIISADSMQVYKGMNIGTAKISPDEMDGVCHHLIDIIEPLDEFNAAEFKRLAGDCIDEISSRGHIPIIAGGTGFYINAVLYDTSFTEHKTDNELRRSLFDYADRFGNEALYAKLCEIDPEYAVTVHKNNVKRIVRALEYYTLTGEKFSEHNNRERMKESPYNYAYFVLNMDRNRLYKRIDERVDKMIADGLFDEVKELMALGCTKDMVSMKGLGYKEIIDYYTGEASYDEAIETIKRETRHFAKRQLTWFKREPDIIWLDKDTGTDDELLEYIMSIIKEKGISD